MDLTKHYLISGRVQGVGFRAFTARQARQLNLKGWVRNLTDGRVEAVVSGPNEAIEEFEGRVRKGPSHARVDTFSVEEWYALDVPDFEVRKDGLQPCEKSSP